MLEGFRPYQPPPELPKKLDYPPAESESCPDHPPVEFFKERGHPPPNFSNGIALRFFCGYYLIAAVHTIFLAHCPSF